MIKLILVLVLAWVTVTSRAHIRFAVVPCDINVSASERNNALMRRALLKANGKEWFMEHIMTNCPKTSFTINFIAGDYCTVGEYYVSEKDSKNGMLLSDEFYSGLKKALVYLSANNETLLLPCSVTADELLGKKVSVTLRIRTTNSSDLSKYRINFDGYDYSLQEDVDYLQYSFNVDPSVKEQTVSNNGQTRLMNEYDSQDVPLKNDSERVFRIRKRIDDHILSIPLTGKIKILPWSYTPGLHKNKNVICLEDL